MREEEEERRKMRRRRRTRKRGGGRQKEMKQDRKEKGKSESLHLGPHLCTHAVRKG